MRIYERPSFNTCYSYTRFFETNLSGEIQARITADTTVLQTVIGSSLSVALRNILLFLGGIGWLFWTNPKLTSIVLIAVPLLVLPVVIFGRRVRRLSRTSQDKVASVGAYVGEALQHIKIVQGMNHQQLDEKAFTEHVESAFGAGIQRIQQRAFDCCRDVTGSWINRRHVVGGWSRCFGR